MLQLQLGKVLSFSWLRRRRPGKKNATHSKDRPLESPRSAVADIHDEQERRIISLVSVQFRRGRSRGDLLKRDS